MAAAIIERLCSGKLQCVRKRLGFSVQRHPLLTCTTTSTIHRALIALCHSPVGDTQIGGQPNQAVGHSEPAARRSADDHHVHPRQLGRRAQQHVGSLQRLDSPDEGHHVLVGRQPQLGPGGPAVARTEHRQVDARVSDVDAGRVAGYSETSCAASSSVLAINRSASSTTCCSPTVRSGGSGVSPSASAAFFTAASVCAVCTNGTDHRSRASQPTWPDSQ